MSLRESLNRLVSDYMSSSFARVEESDSIAEAARAMMREKATEALVVKGSSTVGIITERDILYKVVAAGGNPSILKVRDVMSSPVETIDAGSKVAEAIAKMSGKGFRRLGVTRGGRIVGMVTQEAVVTGNVDRNFVLPELALPTGFSCPYCGATLKSREDLSTHIDRVHAGGLGLLQGDATKW